MSENDRLRRLLGRGGVSPSARSAMVARVRAGGVDDPEVLAALGAVPREEFVAEGFEEAAYADRPLPIGYGQTISQPLMVALMLAALRVRRGDLVLEVGTGSGYAAALLATLGARVVSVERVAPLARAARHRLERLGFDVEVIVADGSASLAGRGPFDGIVVAAAAPRVPRSLLADLGAGGRLVVPVASVDRGAHDRLVRATRRVVDGCSRVEEEDLGPCRFVPLLGAEGFPAEPG